MKLETFFEKFNQFADAPDAVAKMRELILQLAVHGTVVDPLDGDFYFSTKPEPCCLHRILQAR